MAERGRRRAARQAFFSAGAGCWGLGLLLLLGLPSSSASEPAPWYPLRVDHEWVYREHSDRSLDPSEGAIERSFEHKRVSERVVGKRPPQGPEAAVYEILRTQFRRTRAGGRSEDRSTLRFSSDAEGIRLHGLIVDDGLRSGGLRYPYDPPVVLLPPAGERAKPWQAGTLDRPGVRVLLAGRVIGREDVDVGGVYYRDSLHVRYDGRVQSEAKDAKGSLTLKDGRYQSDVWFVRGIGIVLEVAEIRGDLNRPDGEVVRMTDITSRRLESYTAAK